MVRDRLKVLFSKSAYFFEGSEYAGTPFTEILIDMSCYHSDEVVQGSLHLLNRYFSAETSLFDSALQTQLLLTEESKEVSGSHPQITDYVPLCVCRSSRRSKSCFPFFDDCSVLISEKPADLKWFAFWRPSLPCATCPLKSQNLTLRTRRSSTTLVSVHWT